MAQHHIPDIYGLVIDGVMRISIADVIQQVGQRIRVLREETGCSQHELAALCGLHRSHIGQLERGICNFTVNTLVRVASGLKIQVESNISPSHDTAAR